MLDLEDKAPITNMVKELKEIMLKELKEYIITTSHHIENITKEEEILKKS